MDSTVFNYKNIGGLAWGLGVHTSKNKIEVLHAWMDINEPMSHTAYTYNTRGSHQEQSIGYEPARLKISYDMI